MARKNGLKLNILKAKCMLIYSARKKVNSRLDLRIDGMDVEQVPCFKFLFFFGGGEWSGF